MKFLVDENVSLAVVERLRTLGHDAEGNLRSDEEADLIKKTVNELSSKKIEGKLLTVYKRFSTIR